jgi:putative phosphoesterase
LILAVISDVHANLEATEACFKRINEIKPDKIICLGDLVDYCAQPNEVTEIIKNSCDKVVLGNHDEAQFNTQLSDGFSDNARVSSVHTRRVINPEHIEYFKSLPYTYSEQNLLFVHSSPLAPKRYKYILTEEAAHANFDAFNEQVCFIGHSHQPLIYKLQKQNVRQVAPGILEKGSRYIINVGSIGQPRDNNPLACFGVLDSEKFEFRYERVQYDIDSASMKILAQGLPQYLAERLYLGI